MIKINWSAVDSFKSLMYSQGIIESQEFSVIVLYHGKKDSERLQVKLNEIDSTLFDVSSDYQIRGLYIYDLECKRMFLRFCDINKVSDLEIAPSSGHPHVLLEFGGMTPECKDVWLDITEAALQQYLNTTEV